MRCPAAIPAIAIGAGVAAGIFVFPPVSRFVPFLFLLTAIAVFAAQSLRPKAQRLSLVVVLIGCGFFFAGAVLGRVADSTSRNQSLRALFDRQVAPGEFHVFANVEGWLRTDAAKGPSGVTLDVQIDRIELNSPPSPLSGYGETGAMTPTHGGALIGVAGELASDRILQWRAGRRVAFPATLRAPTKYLNPGVPDAERHLAWRGIALVGSVKSDRLVEITESGTTMSELLAAARAVIRRAIATGVEPWSARSAAVVSAILIGDRAGLDDEVERRLQEAGTYHVIAISGGNIAILAGLLIFCLRVCRVGPRASALLVIIMLSAYALIVEGGSSVGRATLMAAIYFAAVVCDHRTLPMNVAALTAATLFCLEPLQVVDAGFALTFGATLGILAGMSRFADLFPASPWLRAPAALLMASVCAEIALLPTETLQKTIKRLRK